MKQVSEEGQSPAVSKRTLPFDNLAKAKKRVREELFLWRLEQRARNDYDCEIIANLRKVLLDNRKSLVDYGRVIVYLKRELFECKQTIEKQGRIIKNQEQAIVDLNIVADKQVKDLQEKNERQTRTIKKQREMISSMTSNFTMVHLANKNCRAAFNEECAKNRRLIQELIWIGQHAEDARA